MTEDEAKTKWCPFARAAVAAGLDVVAGNRPEKGATRCIGSACMAWRWCDVHDEAAMIGASGSGAMGPDWRPSHGFCGLAGRPA